MSYYFVVNRMALRKILRKRRALDKFRGQGKQIEFRAAFLNFFKSVEIGPRIRNRLLSEFGYTPWEYFIDTVTCKIVSRGRESREFTEKIIYGYSPYARLPVPQDVIEDLDLRRMQTVKVVVSNITTIPVEEYRS